VLFYRSTWVQLVVVNLPTEYPLPFAEPVWPPRAAAVLKNTRANICPPRPPGMPQGALDGPTRAAGAASRAAQPGPQKKIPIELRIALKKEEGASCFAAHFASPPNAATTFRWRLLSKKEGQLIRSKPPLPALVSTRVTGGGPG
jgi:hypothetical protein